MEVETEVTERLGQGGCSVGLLPQLNDEDADG